MVKKRVFMAVLVITGISVFSLSLQAEVASKETTSPTTLYSIISLGINGHSYGHQGGQAIDNKIIAGGLSHLEPMAFVWINGEITWLGSFHGRSSKAYGISSFRTNIGPGVLVVGSSDKYAFLWNQLTNEMADLGPGVANGVNKQGQVVGRDSHWRATIWENGIDPETGDTGVFSSTPLFTEGRSEATAINESSQVVGHIIDSSDYDYNGFIWKDGQTTKIRNPFNSNTIARDINNNEVVVGFSFGAINGYPGQYAYYWANDSIKILHASKDPGSKTRAYNINDQNEVVGIADGEPVLWRDLGIDGPPTMIYLNELLPETSGWRLAVARAIDNSGNITGWGLINGKPRSFLMTPADGVCRGSIRGNGYYMDDLGHRIQVSANVNSLDISSGEIRHYNTMFRETFASSNIQSIDFPSDGVVQLSGEGTMNKKPGYTFNATITENPILDKWEINIFAPNGDLLFTSIGPQQLSGNLAVTTEDCNF